MSHDRLITAAAAVAVITALSSGTAAAQQNLTGRTLEPLRDAESLFDGLLQHLGGGKNRPVKAAIDRVVVSEDTPRRLVVTVTYSGLGQATLSGEVRDADRRTLDQIEAQPATLTEPKDTKYFTDDQYVLKDRKDIRRNSFTLSLGKTTTINVPVDTAGNIGGLYAALENDPRHFRIVDMNDPAFELRPVHFQVDGAFVDSFQEDQQRDPQGNRQGNQQGDQQEGRQP